MSNKSLFFMPLLFLIVLTLLTLTGCNSSDISKKDSVTSGTTTGFGSSGGPAANVIVVAGNNTIAYGATTSITVVIVDSQGRRTDASIIVTSSIGGTFNGTNTTLSGYTLGGVLSATYTAPSVTYGQSAQINTEIAALVTGTALRGSTIITVIPIPTT